MAAFGTERTPSSTSHLPPAPREMSHASDVWVSLSVAGILCLIAAIIALWPAEQSAKTLRKSPVPALSVEETLPDFPSQSKLSDGVNLPTRFTNPFDASEVFEFPPGTPENAARESVAEMLLERARERRAQLSSVKHVAGRQSAPLRAPTLISDSLFR